MVREFADRAGQGKRSPLPLKPHIDCLFKEHVGDQFGVCPPITFKANNRKSLPDRISNRPFSSRRVAGLPGLELFSERITGQESALLLTLFFIVYPSANRLFPGFLRIFETGLTAGLATVFLIFWGQRP
jgi:hypothetical protein